MWYRATVPHDRMRRGDVYWLEEIPYTWNRVEKGYLEPAEEPEWHKVAPPERRMYPMEDT